MPPFVWRYIFCLANMMNYTDGYHGGRDKSQRYGGMNHDDVCQANVINHAPTDESRFEGNTKMPAFPLATTQVAVWKGRRYVLCLMRSERSVTRLQPSSL